MVFKNHYNFFLIGALLIGILHDTNAQNTTNFIDDATDPAVVPLLELDPSYSLEFTDEFNDNEVDPLKWSVTVSGKSRAARPEIGINSWYWVEENVKEENGNVVLQVSKHDPGTMYCGSISSRKIYERRYGYYETRIKIADASKGTHTAFWFHGKHMGNVDGTGRDGAEIDVFESAWLGDYTKSVIHIDGYGADHKANTRRYETPGLHEGYHTFGLLWTPDSLKIYYDGVLKSTYQGIWVPQEEEYIWLSDGASFGLKGEPNTDIFFVDQQIGFLTEAYVDYVRVWRQPEPAIDSLGLGLESECVSEKDIDWYYEASGNETSNGYYVQVNPEITEPVFDIPFGNGLIKYQFENTIPQEFDLWGRVNISNANSVNYWLKVNSRGYELNTINVTQPNQWEWVLLNQVYLNAHTNEMTIAYQDPGLKIDKFWFANHPVDLQGTWDSALSQCEVDISTNGQIPPQLPSDTLVFEAEQMMISGSSKVVSCGNASNELMVNLLDSGGVSIDSFDVMTGGPYDMIINYLSANDRQAAIYLNNDLIDTLDFPGGGAWCFNDGKMQDLIIPVSLKMAGNSVSIRPIGENGPHLDKVTVARNIPPVEVNFSTVSETMMEGESITITVEVAEPLDASQKIALKLEGLPGSSYEFGSDTITIAKGQRSSFTSLEILQDYAITGDRVITIAIDEVTNRLTIGNPGSVQITLQEMDEPIGVALSADKTEIEEGGQALITLTSAISMPVSQVIKLAVSGREGSFLFDNYLSIEAGSTSTEVAMTIMENEEYDDDQTIVVSFDSLSNLLSPAESLSLTILNNDVPLSLEDYGITLSPVPAYSVMTIKGIEHYHKIDILDLSGRLQAVPVINRNTLDVSNLKNGIYLIKVYLDQQVLVSRFIKQSE